MTEKRAPLLSKRQQPCLTKCIPENTLVLHPRLLIFYKEQKPTCAIDPYIAKKTNKPGIDLVIHAECDIENNDKFDIPNENESMLLGYAFYAQSFLHNIYELESFDHVIKWSLDNYDLPSNTIKRVHNCAWKEFGSIDNIYRSVVEYYYGLIHNVWMQSFQKKMKIIDSNIDLVTNEIVSYSFVHNMIKKYLQINKDVMSKIDDHYNNLKKFFMIKIIEYIEDRIN